MVQKAFSGGSLTAVWLIAVVISGVAVSQNRTEGLLFTVGALIFAAVIFSTLWTFVRLSSQVTTWHWGKLLLVWAGCTAIAFASFALLEDMTDNFVFDSRNAAPWLIGGLVAGAFICSVVSPWVFTWRWLTGKERPDSTWQGVRSEAQHRSEAPAQRLESAASPAQPVKDVDNIDVTTPLDSSISADADLNLGAPLDLHSPPSAQDGPPGDTNPPSRSHELPANLPAWVGPNWESHYLDAFSALRSTMEGKSAGPTWNWAAALVPFGMWWLYRKLYVGFAVSFLLAVMLFGMSQREGLAGAILPALIIRVTMGFVGDRRVFARGVRYLDGAGRGAALEEVIAHGAPSANGVWLFIAAWLALGMLAALLGGV